MTTDWVISPTAPVPAPATIDPVSNAALPEPKLPK